jgi:hypothetical protein
MAPLGGVPPRSSSRSGSTTVVSDEPGQRDETREDKQMVVSIMGQRGRGKGVGGEVH